MKINILALTHVLLILLFIISPIFINYKIIIFIYLLYLIQINVLGACVLSKRQFKNEDVKENKFWRFYINKYFPKNKITEKILDIILDYVLPISVIFIAFIFQK